MKIKPAGRLTGTINLPGDKSISHRAALLAAMATGESEIENFATSADCASTLDCLQKLGVRIRHKGATIFVVGVGKTGFRAPSGALDCGNSGTTMRLLAGILAGQNFDSVLTGDESLQARPMRRIIEPLTQMGARIESRNGSAPLHIFGKSALESINYDLPVASAQVKTCLLLAALFAAGTTEICERAPTRNHTEKMLRYFGAQIKESFAENNHRVSVSGGECLTARNFIVPSDISSAAFFLVGASCLPHSEIVLRNVGLNPTRRAALDVLRRFDADIEILNEREICGEPVGDLRVFGKKDFPAQAESNRIEGDIIANLIDEIPILAIFGTRLNGGLEIRGAGELRVKESDRIKAIVENLRRMNGKVEEFPDGFKVEKSELKGAQIESYGDHRIAMAFAVAALLADGASEIRGAECANVSFPEFFQTLDKIVK